MIVYNTSTILWQERGKVQVGEMFFKFTKKKTISVEKDKENDEEFIDFDNMNYFKWIYHLIKMSPSDLLLFYNEKAELVDWDGKARTLAQPLGHGLTILTFIIRFEYI